MSAVPFEGLGAQSSRHGPRAPDDGRARLVRIRGPWDPRTQGPRDPGTHGPTDPRTHGPTDPRTHGPRDPRTHGPTDPRTQGPRDRLGRVVGSLDPASRR